MKKHIILLVLVGVFIAGATYLTVVLGKDISEASMLHEKLIQYNKQIEKTKDFDDTFLKEQFEQKMAHFSSPDQFTIIMDEIARLSTSHDIQIRSIEPSSLSKSQDQNMPFLAYLSQIRLSMSVEGDFSNLGLFLSDLENLRNGVISFKSIRFDKNLNVTQNLTLSLQCIIYFFAGDEGLWKAEIPNASSDQPKSRFAEMKRNPFFKMTSKLPLPPKAIRLEGIIYDPAGPIALIDGETRKIGDEVNGMKITNIRRDSIETDDNGKVRVFQLISE